MRIKNRMTVHAATATLGLCALILAGCAATPTLDAQWIDPQFRGPSFAGSRVMVVCEASDNTIRLICEEQLAAHLTATGASVVRAPSDATGSNRGAAAYLPAARTASARGLAVGVVTPSSQAFNQGPQFSIGLGGFRGGSSGVSMGGGVSVPVGSGGSSVNTGFGMELGIHEVASGQLVWTGRASSAPSSNVNAQITDLTRTTAGAARMAGVF